VHRRCYHPVFESVAGLSEISGIGRFFILNCSRGRRSYLDEESKMKIFPLHVDVLTAAGKDLFKHLGDLSPFPSEYRNTVANSFYCRSYVLKFGAGAIEDYFAENLRLGCNVKDINEFHAAVIINGANSAIEMHRAMHGLTQKERNFVAELLVDALKYNIQRVHEKSLLRRTVERKFAKPFPEHQNLWELMMRASKG
jgi:hypothetical protein